MQDDKENYFVKMLSCLFELPVAICLYLVVKSEEMKGVTSFKMFQSLSHHGVVEIRDEMFCFKFLQTVQIYSASERQTTDYSHK